VEARALTTPPRRTGVTLIELMVVLAVIAILAMIALPNMQGSLVRDQIVEASKLAEIAKAPVALAWTTTQSLPADNAAAGLPSADKIVSNLVSAVAVDAGAIHITFGNRANSLIKGKILTVRPAVVEDAQVVPITWLCGSAAPPGNMTAKGTNRTDVPPSYLPAKCR